jgi:16S rRNA (cytosine1402-N4)-methyltransferase
MHHESVLLNETLQLLNPQPGQCIVDCTLGAGGHSAAIIPRLSPGGMLIGLDVDTQALDLARERLEPIAKSANVRLELVQSNFRKIAAVIPPLKRGGRGGESLPSEPATQGSEIDGILADLGVSSMQFDTPERGFSFRFDHPLDMRMDRSSGMTAADILREYAEEDIANLLYNLGEEYKSRRIARAIVQQRQTKPIETTGELEALVRRALRVRGHRRIHPATKTFQALRLAVNQEMDALSEFLDTAPDLLAPGGTLALITFHSLEDRQVKHRFKALDASGRFNQIGKFVGPSDAELEANPRSRSAKLRGIRRTADEHGS